MCLQLRVWVQLNVDRLLLVDILLLFDQSLPSCEERHTVNVFKMAAN